MTSKFQQLSYNPAIPKFAFGTAFDICKDEHANSNGAAKQTTKMKANSTSTTANYITRKLKSMHNNNNNSNTETDNNKSSQQTQETLTEKQFVELLDKAIALGCRHIDCAPIYGTQRLVGQCLKRQQLHSIQRSSFFLTSKVPVNMMGDARTIMQSVNSTLDELGTSYLDLLLIHAPFATQFVDEQTYYPRDDADKLLLDEREGLLERAWLCLAKLKERGIARYIGVSNVNASQLCRLDELHHVDVVQNEHHLLFADREFFELCDDMDVHFEAYAGFGCPRRVPDDSANALKRPTVCDIAKKHNITSAQVVVQWLESQPMSYVIRSDNCTQLEENFEASKRQQQQNPSTRLSNDDLYQLDTIKPKLCRQFTYDYHTGITQHREYPWKEQQQSRNNLSELFGSESPTTATVATSSSAAQQPDGSWEHITSSSTTSSPVNSSSLSSSPASSSAASHRVVNQNGRAANMQRALNKIAERTKLEQKAHLEKALEVTEGFDCVAPCYRKKAAVPNCRVS